MAASFTRDDLLSAAGSRSFERGEKYIDAVANLRLRGGALHATVHGTEPYRVRLGVGSDGLDGLCTCPQAEDGAFCKHLVAVGLAKLVGAGSRVTTDGVELEGEDSGTAELRRHLEPFEHAELVELLLDLAVEDEQVEAGLRTAALRRLLRSETEGDSGALHRHVRGLIPDPEGPEHLEAMDYAERLAELADLVTEVQDAGEPRRAVIFAEHAITRLQEIGNELDDDQGEIDAAAYDLAQAHADACADAHPDPQELAQWLLARQLDPVFGTCFAVVDHADALGEEGIAAYAGLLHHKADGGNGEVPERLLAHLTAALAEYRETEG